LGETAVTQARRQQQLQQQQQQQQQQKPITAHKSSINVPSPKNQNAQK
jgi:hypothetical protein